MRYWKNPEYASYISQHPCCDCGQYSDVDRFGEPRCDASHIKTKGSGGKEYNNLVPHCRSCHMKFENKSKWDKRQYLKLAQKYTDEYFETYLLEIDEEISPLDA